MTLKYRGTSYEASNSVRSGSLDLIEGRYHGLSTQISLPLTRESVDASVSLMVYRGIQLATCKS
ncbi:hypothetical protein C1752_03371 [Acaryochloris thomasi RCC1774]|uniref:DUF4278 domain-containing protein n=1 Tax=Acaryochloris thomasi RCC1774 TaxID=1764569 RepID=A0A2W1JVZ2_9CYAN|nr:DUF4278 domain-containing protein [Acaryochloris thomasi]PZD72901.1 hypothetical protein C1752_03371 [Acaryochloris thomasi RCC1774]